MLGRPFVSQSLVVATVLAIGSATLGAPTVEADSRSLVDAPKAAPLSDSTDSTQAAIEFESFGRWSINGFRRAAAVPGDVRALTLRTSSAGDSFALLNVETGAFERGDPAPEEVRKMVVTADGERVYVLAAGGLEGAGYVSTYSIEGLERQANVEFGSLSTSDDIYDIAPFPGNPDLALASVGTSLAVIEGTTLRPETVSGSSMPRSLVVVDSTLAYGLRDSTLYRIELSSEGVTDVAAVAFNTAPEPIQLIGENIVVGREVFGIDGAPGRMGSFFEVAQADPTLPVRYIDTTPIHDPDFDGFDPLSIVFDAETGDEIHRSAPPCFLFGPQDVLLGDGLKVQVSDVDGLSVIDIPDACGSYGEFTPVDPARVLDSRTGQGMPTARQVASGETLRVKIHGLAGVPETGVESVVLNVTALRQRGVGGGKNFITVWPAGFEQPTVSNLNIGEREVVGNMVTVSTSAGGFVDIYSDRGTVDLTVDVMGYFASSLAPSGARFRNVENVRLLDTRETGGRLGPASSLSINLSGQPLGAAAEYSTDDIVAAVVNVTAVRPNSTSHFRIFPTGADLPDASSANFVPGPNTNRLVTVKTAGASFDVWNSAGTVDVTVDLVGVYVDNDLVDESTEGRFVGLVPFRDFDSRLASPFAGDGSLPAGGLVSSPGWRNEIDLVANLTAIRPSAPGFVSTGPWSGDFDPFLRTSSINFGSGAVVANQAIIRSSTTGEIGIFNSAGATHIALDLFGYYTP